METPPENSNDNLHQQPEQLPEENQTNKNLIPAWLRSKKVILILVVVAGLIILGTYYGLSHRSSSNRDSESSTQSTNESQLSKKESPELTIEAPKENEATEDSKTYVHGAVTPNSEVKINNKQTEVTDGKFGALVELEIGENIINIEAKSKDGIITTKSVTVTRNKVSANEPSIVLSAEMKLQDVKLSWVSSSLDTSYGYNVLESTSPLPTTSDKFNTAPITLNYHTRYQLVDGLVHYFRVCQIKKDGSCGVYSNQVPVISKLEQSSVSSIVVTGIKDKTVNWTFSSQAHGGFTILWSTKPGPTHPGNSETYTKVIPNPITTYGTIDSNVVSGQTYYVRVCENLGGKCGTYSNETSFVAQ